MAATTTILAGAGLAMSAGGGFSKAIGGARQKRAAREAAKKFRRQELENVNRERRISTRGADLAREEAARGTATSIDALASGGIRGVVGGIGSVQQVNNTTARQIGAGLDEQQVALDRDIAMDEARIRQLQEQRDNAELQSIQSQMNAGQQQMYSGIGDIAQSTFAAATSGMFDPTKGYAGGKVKVTPQQVVTGNALIDGRPKAPVFFG